MVKQDEIVQKFRDHVRSEGEKGGAPVLGKYLKDISTRRTHEFLESREISNVSVIEKTAQNGQLERETLIYLPYTEDIASSEICRLLRVIEGRACGNMPNESMEKCEGSFIMRTSIPPSEVLKILHMEGKISIDDVIAASKSLNIKPKSYVNRTQSGISIPSM